MLVLFPMTSKDKPFEFYGKLKLIAIFLDLCHETDGGVHWTEYYIVVYSADQKFRTFHVMIFL